MPIIQNGDCKTKSKIENSKGEHFCSIEEDGRH